MALSLLLPGCFPDDLTDRASLVAGPRVLAVRAEPAESRPGEEVAYTALLAGPGGSIDDAAVSWAFCASPKPLTENNAVSSACLGDGVRPIDGLSLSVTAATPLDACSLFGPETPPGGQRPVDPDETGGFYQPLRVEALGLTAFARARIACALPNAPIEAAIALKNKYVFNQNPSPPSLVARVGGEPVSLDHVPIGAEVRFEAGWLAEDAEPYVMFDPARRAVVARREVMRVAWYVTAGEMAYDVTGREEGDPEHAVTNAWRAPLKPGPVSLWLVLRDSRGGVSHQAHTMMLVE